MPKQQAQSASAKMVSGVKKASSDVLVDIAQEVETLSQKKAFDLADELIQQGGESEFKLGGVLAVISDKAKTEGGEEWLEGRATFKALCDERFRFSYRKAMYLIDIYKHLVEQQIPWAAVKDLGWTKLSLLAAKKELNAKNIDKWVKKAEKLTVEQLKDVLKSGDVTSKVGTMTIKVQHEDQKEAVHAAIEKAKKESGTEYDAVALTNIAQAYLGNAVTMEKVVETEEKPKGKAKVKEYWTNRLRAQIQEMKGDISDEQESAELALNAVGDEYPNASINVEFPA